MMLFDGRKEWSFFAIAIACVSSSAMKWMLPLTDAWASAEANWSSEACWPVEALMTSGPQMNIWAFFRVMMRKSVSAGEYAAPPAHGPAMIEICGTTPEASTLR